jgi:hypothetical protein
MIKKIITLILLISLNFMGSVSLVSAEDIVVSDNGSNSQNNVNVTQDTSSNVSQDNTASVANTVDTSTETGNNSANDNSGESVAVSTGDATNVVASETVTNVSNAEVGCCSNDGGGSVVVSGNGQDSQNTANVNNSSTTTVNITQNATITTNISGYANTGNNSANDNSGDVSIETGNIYARGEIINASNFASVSVASGNGDFLVKIYDNGRDSTNDIYLNLLTNTIVNINNNSRLANVLNWDLNTGGNSASDNDGDVKIKTGDIRLDIIIRNLANISKVIVDCHCEVKAEENPPTDQEENPEENNNDDDGDDGDDNDEDSDDGSGGPGEVLGETLPETGNNSTLGLTLASIMLIAYGLYLRKTSSTYKRSAYYLRLRYNTLKLS